MTNVKEVVYMVEYKDDYNRKHLTFVKSLSSVKYYKIRFGAENVVFSPTKSSSSNL